MATSASTGPVSTFTSTIQLAGATLDHSDCLNFFNQLNQAYCGVGAGAAGVTVNTFANAFHGFVIQYTLVPATPPSVNKAFSPNVIDPNGTTVLTFTVTNPAGSPAVSNVGFVDTLPVGLKATGLATGSTCANAAAATTVSASGSTITV
ncbi:MAG: hypothetical protein ABIP49_11075, partial [Lysobacterales bacterium]